MNRWKKIGSAIVLAALGVIGAGIATAQQVTVGTNYYLLKDSGNRVILGYGTSIPSEPAGTVNDGALFVDTDDKTLYIYDQSTETWVDDFTLGTLTGDVTGNLTGDVIGSISGGTVDGIASGLLVTTTTNTGDLVLDADDCGNYFNNTGDTDGSTYTLPASPPEGCTIRFIIIASQSMTISSSTGSENVYQVGNQCTADSMTSSTATHQAVLTAHGGVLWLDDRADFTCTDI